MSGRHCSLNDVGTNEGTGRDSRQLGVDNVNEVTCYVTEVEPPKAPIFLDRAVNDRGSSSADRCFSSVEIINTDSDNRQFRSGAPFRGRMQFNLLRRVFRQKRNPPHV